MFINGNIKILYIYIFIHCFTSRRNALMFNNEHMADVHFIVGPAGESERVPGHKVSPHTPYFGLLNRPHLIQTISQSVDLNHVSEKGNALKLDETDGLSLPSLSVCAGSGELGFLCHVLWGSRRRRPWYTYSRCGTRCFSHPAQVSLTH